MKMPAAAVRAGFHVEALLRPALNSGDPGACRTKSGCVYFTAIRTVYAKMFSGL
jgi:hypothetical protein